MSLTGDVPLRLTRADVWRLVKDRFNENEVAYLAGVPVSVARGMIAEAIPTEHRPAYGVDMADAA